MEHDHHHPYDYLCRACIESEFALSSNAEKEIIYLLRKLVLK